MPQMKRLNKLCLIVFMLLLVDSLSWCQIHPPTGGLAQDSVYISLDLIKAANIKLIEAKANKQIVIVQDSIISNQRSIINDLDSINDELQDRIIIANQNTERLIKDIDKYQRRAKRASWAAVGSGSAFLVLLILIL